MKLHRNTFYILFMACGISLYILVISPEHTIWNNFGISVFSSALLASIITLASYFDSRNKLICDINKKILSSCLALTLLKVSIIRTIDGDKEFLSSTKKFFSDAFHKQFNDLINEQYFLTINFDAFEYAEISTEYVIYLTNVHHWLSDINSQLLYIESQSRKLLFCALKEHGIRLEYTPYNIVFEQYPHEAEEIYLEIHKLLCTCDKYFDMIDHVM